MKHKAIMAITLLALVSMLIMPVMAETLTGELGEVGYNSSNWDSGGVAATSWKYHMLYYTNVESAGDPAVLIRWAVSILDTFDAGAPPSGQTSVIIRVSNSSGYSEGEIVGSGELGFQRKYNGATPPVEIVGGYVFLIFDSLNTTGLPAGPSYFYLDYEDNELYNMTCRGYSNSYIGLPTGFPVFSAEGGGTSLSGGPMVYNRNVDFFSQYSVTKPSGLGIAGTVTKQGTNGNWYNTLTVISDSNHNTITGEGTANQDPFYFTTNATQIYISTLSYDMVTWSNSSLLFSVPTPTVTPTPSPTIPPGYIVTYVRTFDPLTNSDIYGTDISMYDVENASWTNYTADADGRGEIYTLPYHTLNLYGTYPTAGVYNDAELLGAETGYTGGKLFYLDMYPYTPAPASGYVELYTTVRNRDDKSPVTYASIGTTIISTGAYFGSSSGSTGTDIYTYPNDTALRIVVNKPGYQTATVYTNTGDDEKKYVIIDMDRSTVTPTVTATIIPGEITIRPTYAPYCDPYASNYDEGRCNAGKDSEMMNQVRDAGPMLIGLAIIATIFGLVKLMGKK